MNPNTYIHVFDASPLLASRPFSDDSPRDPRDPRVEQPAGLAPPALRPGGGPSADAARQVQRQERARVLESIYRQDVEAFDRLFLRLWADDAGLLYELRGRAYARAAVIGRER